MRRNFKLYKDGICMTKEFKLYVINYQSGMVGDDEQDGVIGIVAEDEEEAYRYLEEWHSAYGVVEEPGEVLLDMVMNAKTFEIVGDKVEAGVSFQFTTVREY